MRARGAAWVLTLGCGLPGVLCAQTGPDAERLHWARSLEGVRGGAVQVRWDEESGTPACLSCPEGQVIPARSAAEAAQRWLQDELLPLLEPGVLIVGPEQPVPAGGAVLVYQTTRDLGAGSQRVDFQQVVSGTPVLDADVRVELMAVGEGFRPVGAQLRYLPGVPSTLGQKRSAAVEAQLLDRFPACSDGEGTVVGRTGYEAVIASVAPGRYRPALRVRTLCGDPPQAMEMLIDAEDGTELTRHSQTCQATAQGLAYPQHPGSTPRTSYPLGDLYVNQGADRVTTAANGTHPLTGMVSLDRGLAGPYLRVFVSGADSTRYTGPADIDLRPAESSAAQDELAAWRHLTSYNQHLRASYPEMAQSRATRTRFAVLVRARRNGQPVRNAFFTPSNVRIGGETFTGYIGLGTWSGRQSARSASVVRHEYTHALFSEIVRLTGNVQSGGLNEGLADYLPAAMADDPLVGAWLVSPAIRDLRRQLVWPRDSNNQVHRVGHIFGGALWRARTAAAAQDSADRLAIDRAVVGGIFRMRNRPSLLDARAAIVAADRAINQGRFRVILQDSFAAHGIGPAAQNSAPVLTPVGDHSLQVGDTLSLVLQGTDGDGDPLSYAASPLANATLNAQGGTFSFTPDAGQVGTQSVTFTISDGQLTASETIAIAVTPAPLPSAPPTPTPTKPPVSAPPAPLPPVVSGPVTGTTTPGALPGADAGGSSGGGGCSLAARGSADAPAGGWLGLLVLLGLVGLRRRTATDR